ncbi:MAG: hypothetical protein MZV64_73270 [Ignavibacteriales bacterium]|nr:hypothetical protein [Ignavibacteriales bacterium]
MPSPAGHLIAGVAIAWAAESFGPLRPHALEHGSRAAAAPAVTPLVLACAALALAPDARPPAGEPPHLHPQHRGRRVVALRLRRRRAWPLGAPGAATGLACGLAVGSHIVLDWLGRDGSTPRGLMALWPLSATYFYSGLDLFADVSRRYWKPEEFIVKNAVSIAREMRSSRPSRWQPIGCVGRRCEPPEPPRAPVRRRAACGIPA